MTPGLLLTVCFKEEYAEIGSVFSFKVERINSLITSPIHPSFIFPPISSRKGYIISNVCILADTESHILLDVVFYFFQDVNSLQHFSNREIEPISFEHTADAISLCLPYTTHFRLCILNVNNDRCFIQLKKLN